MNQQHRHHYRLILLIIAAICPWSCAALKARKACDDQNHGEVTEECLCERKCEECFTCFDIMQRLGCLEKCMAQGVKDFTCPGRKTFLGDVKPHSPQLQREVTEFFENKSRLITETTVDTAVNVLYTTDSIWIGDNQIPVIGRSNRALKQTHYNDANPEASRIEFIPDEYGEDMGIIWANGHVNDYDESDKEISTPRFMCLLTHSDDGSLQEYTFVMFTDP